MNDNTTLLDRIAEASGRLTNKETLLAQYIVNGYQHFAYTTLSELAKGAGVSETTVVRLVNDLGYRGFPDFMSALRSQIETTRAKMNMTAMDEFVSNDKFEFPRDTVRAVFAMEMQVMAETMAHVAEADFDRAVGMIADARRVLIVGCGANACCVRAMQFALQILRPNVFPIEALGLHEASVIQMCGEEDVCVVFSTPRYPTDTQRIVKLVSDFGVPVIGVSNSSLAPLYTMCSVFFQVPEKYITYIDSNAAYMALIHAFAFGVYQRDKDGSREKIGRYDEFVRSTGFYERGDLELVNAYFKSDI